MHGRFRGNIRRTDHSWEFTFDTKDGELQAQIARQKRSISGNFEALMRQKSIYGARLDITVASVTQL